MPQAAQWAGFWGGIMVEPPREARNTARLSPHAGPVYWYPIRVNHGWIERLTSQPVRVTERGEL